MNNIEIQFLSCQLLEDKNKDFIFLHAAHYVNSIIQYLKILPSPNLLPSIIIHERRSKKDYTLFFPFIWFGSSKLNFIASIYESLNIVSLLLPSDWKKNNTKYLLKRYGNRKSHTYYNFITRETVYVLTQKIHRIKKDILGKRRKNLYQKVFN